MKKIAMVLIGITIVVCGGGYVYLRFFQVGPKNEQSVNGQLPAAAEFKIGNDFGLIRVVATGGDTIDYQATKTIRISPAQSIAKALDSIEIVESITGKDAEVSVKYNHYRAMERKTDIEFKAPPETNLKLKTHQANIWVESSKGSVDIESEESQFITIIDNVGPLKLKAGESETHIYIAPENASTVIEQKAGLMRIIVTGEETPNLSVTMQNGKITLTLNPKSHPVFKVLGDGAVIDTTGFGPGDPTGDRKEPFLYGEEGKEPEFTLSLGHADLTIEYGSPVVLRTRPGVS